MADPTGRPEGGRVSKTIAKLNLDPRVSKAWSEVGTGDGYWVMLKDGFADLVDDPWTPTHTIHEWTIKDLLLRMRAVSQCKCKECVAAIEKAKLQREPLKLSGVWRHRGDFVSPTND